MNGSLRTLITACVIALVLTGLYFAGHILVPFLMAGVIAYVLNPLVGWLQAHARVGRHVAVLVVMVGLALLALGMLSLAVPELASQIGQFTDRLPAYVEQVRLRLLPLIDFLETKYPGYLENAQKKALESAESVAPAVGGWLAYGFVGILSGIAKVVVWALTIVIIPVFAYYLLVDYKDLADMLLGVVPIQMRPGLRRRTTEINKVLRAWVKGQFTVAILLAIIYSVGLTLLGVPLGLLIGFIGGLANLVPYLGLVVGFIPAALLAVLDSGSWLSVVWVAGVFLLGQVLEGTVISPRIMGSGLGLPPALILLAVLVGGELFGFTGLLLAVPCTAAGYVLLKDLRREHDEATLELAAPPPSAAARRPVRRRRPTA
ncbi:MAG: AI-2E family transporter [Candidatus Polarisedimenticolia bacterium]